MRYPQPTKRKKKKPSMKKVFAQVWATNKHVCSNCGIDIPYPVIHNFSHKKSKGAWPDLKYDPDNIELLCSSVNRVEGVGCHESSHTDLKTYRNRKHQKSNE